MIPHTRPMASHLVVLLAVVSTVAWSASAEAQVRIVAQTDVPVFYGFGVDAELPGRFRLATSLGRLPAGYVGLANSAIVPVFKSEGYSPEAAQLVQATIQRSNVWRTTVGWRPLQRKGFVFGAGYTLAGLGGDATGAELISGASGVAAPQSDASPEFQVSATVQLLHAEVAWTWDLPANLWLKTGVGMGMTIKANTEVEVESMPEHPTLRAQTKKFQRAVEVYLHETLTSYVHPPHISVALGWWI